MMVVTVLTYNMHFEKVVIKKLAAEYEEYSVHLLDINDNIKDLMVPFQQKQYVTPIMMGSYSIKCSSRPIRTPSRFSFGQFQVKDL
jgi:hypothetical protein